jgi:hypothetical protein
VSFLPWTASASAAANDRLSRSISCPVKQQKAEECGSNIVRPHKLVWVGHLQSNLLVGEAAYAESLCLELAQRLALARVFTLLLGGRKLGCQRCTLR